MIKCNKYPMTGLKREREKRGCSRKVFAKEFNNFVTENDGTVLYTQEVIKNWETGRSAPKTIQTIYKLCEFLKCDIDYLFGRIDCKTHDLSFIHDCTGLTEETIESLFFSNHNKRIMNFINYLLTCEKETDSENVLLLNYIAIRLEILKDNHRMGMLSQIEEAGLLFQINAEIYNAITGYLKEPEGDQGGEHKTD